MNLIITIEQQGNLYVVSRNDTKERSCDADVVKALRRIGLENVISGQGDRKNLFTTAL